jgi:transmembrane 9 superfamily protein 3
VARPIPQRPFLRSPTFVCLLAGFLPFGSIFIETYFIFSSFSTYKFYYVFGFMFAVYVILALTTACVTIVSTYFLLNSEGASCARAFCAPSLCLGPRTWPAPLLTRALPSLAHARHACALPTPLFCADHRWQWHSFMAGASTGLYVFAYSFYYFFFRTECVILSAALLYPPPPRSSHQRPHAHPHTTPPRAAG